MLKIKLPRDFTSKKINEITNHLIDDKLSPIVPKVLFDFQNLRYISPSAVALLDNLIGWLESNKVTVYIININIKEKKMCPINFLKDAGFFKKYLDSELNEQYLMIPKECKTILPITNLTSNKYEEWSKKFEHWYSYNLGVSKVEVASIVAAVKDILNNVTDHANITSCGIFAQFIENQDKFYLAISDFGVGIPTNVKRFLKDDNLEDVTALKWAVEEGNSTKSTPRNRGVGLHVLLKNVVINCEGIVEIYSNHAKIICKKGNDGLELVEVRQELRYPGTLILIKMNKSNALSCLDQKEEFVWDDLL